MAELQQMDDVGEEGGIHGYLEAERVASKVTVFNVSCTCCIVEINSIFSSKKLLIFVVLSGNL